MQGFIYYLGIVVGFFSIFSSCAKSPRANVEEIDAIKDVLSKQQICWNNADIDRFMLGFWNSNELRFSWVNGI